MSSICVHRVIDNPYDDVVSFLFVFNPLMYLRDAVLDSYELHARLTNCLRRLRTLDAFAHSRR